MNEAQLIITVRSNARVRRRRRSVWRKILVRVQCTHTEGEQRISTPFVKEMDGVGHTDTQSIKLPCDLPSSLESCAEQDRCVNSFCDEHAAQLPEIGQRHHHQYHHHHHHPPPPPSSSSLLLRIKFAYPPRAEHHRSIYSFVQCLSFFGHLVKQYRETVRVCS